MIQETLAELNEKIDKAHEALRRELAKLRTGRAHPDLLDAVKVDYYGVATPIRQLATISVPEPRMLAVKPFDRSQIVQVEKAIRESDLGLNPSNDGEIIRVPMPQLTEERRRELVKVARKHGEECKVAIRHARHEARDVLAELEKEGEASADDVERAMKKLEEAVKKATSKVDEIVERKEQDILAI